MAWHTWLELWIPLVVFGHLFSGAALLLGASVWRKRPSQHCGLERGPSVKASTSSSSGGLQQVPVLAWHDLGCSYDVAGEGGKGVHRKAVLKGGMGCVQSGQLVGLLGPSGGGKSTLLEILAGRKALGHLSGFVAIASERVDNPATAPALQGKPELPPCAHLQAVGGTAAPLTLHLNEQQHGVTNSLTQPTPQWQPWQHPCQLAPGQRMAWHSVKDHARVVRPISAFVAQENAFPPSLTAHEVLTLHATLLGVGQKSRGRCTCGGSLPLTNACACTAESTEDAVRQALQGVGLSNQATTLVGGPLPGGLVLRGLSGGERKRLAVACGMLDQPRLLLLDEPTTGLDAAAAVALVSQLRALCAATGMSVVASLHQPRASIWQCLDGVVLLSSGRCVYSGPRQGLVPWLSHQGFTYQPECHGSAPDWAMDLVNTAFHKPKSYFGHGFTTVEELDTAAGLFAQEWEDAQAQLLITQGLSKFSPAQKLQIVITCLVRGNEAKIAPAVPVTEPSSSGLLQKMASCLTCGRQARWSPASRSAKAPAHQEASWWLQAWLLAVREARLVTRNPADVAGRMLVFCWAGVAVGLVFFGIPGTVQGLQTLSALVYIEVLLVLMLPFAYMSLYVADRRMVCSELAAGLYLPSAYYAAKSLVILFFSLINAVVFLGIVYGMSGMVPEGVIVMRHLLTGSLAYLVASQGLYVMSISAPNQDIAFMYAVIWMAINTILANYPIRVVDYTMRWVRPLRFLSAMYYTFSGLLSVEFTASPAFDCSTGFGQNVVQLLPSYLPNTPAARFPFVQSLLTDPGRDCSVDGSSVLEVFEVTWPWWAYAVALAGYLVVLHVLSFVALRLAVRRERR